MVARTILGVLLCAVGVVWLGQGTGLIHGSFMTGDALWAVIGGILLVLGVVLLSSAWRLRGRA
jgi:hypothetical protein